MKIFSLKEILDNDPAGILNVPIRMDYPISNYIKLGDKNILKNYIKIKEYIINSDPKLVESIKEQYIGFKENNINIFTLNFDRNGIFLKGKNQNNVKIKTKESNFILRLNFNKILIPRYSSKQREKLDYGAQSFYIQTNDDLVTAKKIVDYFLKNK